MPSVGLSSAVSVIALGVSLFTLWFTVLRRGAIRSTHPSFVVIKYDFEGNPLAQAKIFFRSLMFSTGKRGLVVENLFLRVTEGTRQDEFSFWAHGDGKLTRGSGIFVSDTGVAVNHHFTPTDSDTLFWFSAGRYSVELMATLVKRKHPVSLWKIVLEVPAGVFDTSIAVNKAIFYNWSPQARSYVMTVEDRFGSKAMAADLSDLEGSI